MSIRPPGAQHALDKRVHRGRVGRIGLHHEETRIGVIAHDVAERGTKGHALRRVAHNGRDVRPTREICAEHRGSEIPGRAGDDRRVRRKIEHAPVVWARCRYSSASTIRATFAR